jgi:PilZ domain-containing protein
MRHLGDRREHPRFEVFGACWGAFGVNEPVRVINITPDGALLDTRRAFPVESVQSVHLTVDGLGASVEGRVRHLTAVSTDGGQECYLIGLEFVSPSASFVEAVEHMVERVATPHSPHLSE